VGLFEPYTPKVQPSQQLTNLVSVFHCGIILSLSFTSSSPKKFFQKKKILSLEGGGRWGGGEVEKTI
jgi:hypothetical protein